MNVEKNIEKLFNERFANEFIHMKDNLWKHESGMTNAFIVKDGEDVVTAFKRRFPREYKTALNYFFDIVHPY